MSSCLIVAWNLLFKLSCEQRIIHFLKGFSTVLITVIAKCFTNSNSSLQYTYEMRGSRVGYSHFYSERIEARRQRSQEVSADFQIPTGDNYDLIFQSTVKCG